MIERKVTPNKKTIIVGYFALLIFLSSCGYRQEYLVSEALKARGENINYSRIDYKNFDLHLRLYNDVRKLDMSYFIVVPTKIDRNSKLLFDSEFRLIFAVLPKNNLLSINFNDVYLQIGGKKYHVSSIKGPVSYFPYKNFALPKNMSSEIEKGFVDQGIIFSLIDSHGQMEKLGNHKVRIVNFTEVGRWNCYEMTFNTPTVTPEKEIMLNINSVVVGDETILIEPIVFHDVVFVDIGSVP